MALKKILGLDIGTTSIGWAVNKEVKSNTWTIDDFGVRIFNEPVDVKKSASFAAERRNFRSKRRLIRRKVRRIRDLKYYLEKYGSIKVKEIDNHFLKLKDKNQNKNYKYSNDINPYFIRKMAIEGKPITWLQFAIALINIAKRRGYDDSFITKSDDSEEIKNDDSYYDKIGLGKELIKEHTYPIIALEHLKIFLGWNKKNESLNKDYKYVKNTEPNKKYLDIENNKSHNFFYFSRADYFNEVKEIINQQKKHLNLSEDLIKRLIGEDGIGNKKLSTIFRQRPFEDGPGNKNDEKRKYKGFSQENVGNDIFLNEKRMWSSLIINDLFILLAETSKIIITGQFNKDQLVKLNNDIISKYFKSIFKDSKTFKNEFISSAINLNIPKENIHIKISENFKFGSLFINKLLQFMNDDFIKNGLSEIKDFVFNKNKNLNSINTNKFILDKFGNLIAENITPWLLLQKLREESFYDKFDQNKIKNYFENKEKNKKNKIEFKNLNEKIIYIVNNFSTSPSKVSYKYACMALNAFLFEGKRYGDFQSEFNKDEFKFNKDIVKIPFGPICDPDVAHNPMVMRALSQARKVVKELYKEYKWFDSIVVESARELTSSLKDRKKIKQMQDESYNKNLEISNLINQHNLANNEINRKKIKLWKSQNEVSIYSGEPIDILRLEDYEIDHIVPRSKINDDSFDNIVLVLKEENQLKKNRVPLEVGVKLIRDEKAYKLRCDKLKKEKLISKRKYDLLMSKSSDDDIIKNISSRELNDTRYISKYFTNYLKKSIEIYQKENGEYQKNNFKVFNPTGSLTSGYRKAWLRNSGWGLDIKTRNISHFHHAVDAMILSNMASESRIKFYTDCLRIWNLVKDKNQENLSKEEKEDIECSYREILKSWKDQKNLYGLWFPGWEERFEKIKNMELMSFVDIAPPIVGSINLQRHVNERIPVKLNIEKKTKTVKDSDNNEKNVSYYEAKLDKVIWEEEYNKEEINRLKKMFPDSNIRYPFISYKENNKIMGSFAGSENYVSEKELNDPKKDKNNYKKTEKGIINLSNYYGTLLVKYPNKKIDFDKIRKIDMIQKYNEEKNKSKKINFKNLYNKFLDKKIKESNGKIFGILRPGTIFKALKEDQWKTFVYRGITGSQIISPYIFIPNATHKEVTGWTPVPGPSYFSDIKILKIDILGRRIN